MNPHVENCGELQHLQVWLVWLSVFVQCYNTAVTIMTDDYVQFFA